MERSGASEVFKQRPHVGKMVEQLRIKQENHLAAQALREKQQPGSTLMTEANIASKRAELDEQVLKHLDLANPDRREVAAQCETLSIKLPVDNGKTYIRMFIFKPKGLEPLGQPAHIWGHGGGAVMTTAEMYVTFMQKRCLSANCVVIVPDFRNAPEAKCPKGMNDIYDCIKHVYENADCYGIDKNRICLGGRSGGAYLALGAGLIMAQRNESHMIKAMFLSAPMFTDVLITTPQESLKDFEKDPSKAQWIETFKMIGHDFYQQQIENDPWLFPGKMDIEDVKKLPPTALFTGEFDFCRRDALMFAEKLKAAGKFLGMQDMPGTTHGYEFHYTLQEAQWNQEEWDAAYQKWVVK